MKSLCVSIYPLLMLFRSCHSVVSNSTINNSSAAVVDAPFWFAEITHQGFAPFSNTTSYQVFRNVKDFGAVGDGVTDDTAAINNAISSGARCGPGTCASTTKTPAIIYFPGGTYAISSPIIDFYFTQIIGNPNNLPVIKATSNFAAFALIDGDQYLPGIAENPAGMLAFKSINTFYRQVRNLILDTTAVSPNVSVNAIHWPTAQATSLENVVFKMSSLNGTQHQGLFIESGESICNGIDENI